jgi:hypothetical protein
MKIRTLVVTTATIVGVAVPVATASQAKTPVHPTGHHKASAHSTATLSAASTSTARKTTAPGVVYVAPFGPLPIITPRYIYFPALPADPNAAPSADECTFSGNNCTPEQLCELWGQC